MAQEAHAGEPKDVEGLHALIGSVVENRRSLGQLDDTSLTCATWIPSSDHSPPPNGVYHPASHIPSSARIKKKTREHGEQRILKGRSVNGAARLVSVPSLGTLKANASLHRNSRPIPHQIRCSSALPPKPSSMPPRPW
jgi:hypothetical protein